MYFTKEFPFKLHEFVFDETKHMNKTPLILGLNWLKDKARTPHPEQERGPRSRPLRKGASSPERRLRRNPCAPVRLHPRHTLPGSTDSAGTTGRTRRTVSRNRAFRLSRKRGDDSESCRIEDIKGKELTDELIEECVPNLRDVLQKFKGMYFGGTTSQAYVGFMRNVNKKEYDKFFLSEEGIYRGELGGDGDDNLIEILDVKSDYFFNTPLQIDKEPFFLRLNIKYRY